LWHPVEDEEESKKILSLDDNTIKLWDIEAGGSTSAKETGTIALGAVLRVRVRVVCVAMCCAQRRAHLACRPLCLQGSCNG
jgi:hypothetical protein